MAGVTTLQSGVRRISVSNYSYWHNGMRKWVHDCAWCGNARSTMFEYGRAGRTFCNIACWRAYWGV